MSTSVPSRMKSGTLVWSPSMKLLRPRSTMSGILLGSGTVGDIVEDLEAGRLELNDVQHVGVYHVLDLLPLDDMRGARVTLPFLVDESSHHDLSDVGRRLSQADVVVGASRNEFDRLVAISQHRDAQRRGFRRAVECETSVRPDRSAVGTAACVVSHDVGSDDGLSRGVVRHAAAMRNVPADCCPNAVIVAKSGRNVARRVRKVM